MPTYDFVCECGKKIDKFLLVGDRDVPQFCECGKQLRRIVSVPQPAIFRVSGNQMALDSLNAGISCKPEDRARTEAGVLAGINPAKKVVGRGFSPRKKNK